MRTLQTLTEEKFKEIYTNEKLRNEVAFAVVCLDSNSQFKHKKTVGYPTDYIVTDEQIKEAQKELERAKAETYKKHRNSLLFVGMGMTYEPRYEDDVCNHRIRTQFRNSKGKIYFVEFGTGRGEEMRCDYSIDVDRQRREKDDQVGYNYSNLERSISLPKYTKANILKLINDMFDCKFKEIVIDNYNTHPSDREIICESPKG